MDTQWWRQPKWTWAWGVLAGLGAIAVVGTAVWQVPWWFDAHHLNADLTQPQATTVTGVRTALLGIGAGSLAAVGIVYTHRTLHQNREGQVTDRYTKAISQIASEKPVEQLGGIYALERIMRDSKKDHSTIVEVLASFVREHAPAPVERTTQEQLRLARRRLRTRAPHATAPGGVSATQSTEARLPEPVQAAMTVLGRRPQDRDEPFRLNLRHTGLLHADLTGARLERAFLAGAHLCEADLIDTHLERADLRGARLERAILGRVRLEGADLSDAHLERAFLAEARLESADLRGASLRRAILDKANLYEARLVRARLEEADLTEARLERADLRVAHLEGADLTGARLDEADLNKADLEGAQHLTVEQVVSARPSQSTSLPAHLATDARIMARIAAVEKEVEQTRRHSTGRDSRDCIQGIRH
ncbi:hypothetical protein GPZ77_33285 [Streptomyces sp. QHH-9511]|uniref:pentapeptide repeat-containing protein n=1 Tax=Streptomyces sp. QHH-9511 TaxID=2684468 RepID=UPI0013161300|nr:pentapeptide repeat-containing protein [Streptomyces sp. QHH-9511]QGZ52539.1 hypothetical protein GPZ77_33285 [Streptomyces sp. QHH-9511]